MRRRWISIVVVWRGKSTWKMVEMKNVVCLWREFLSLVVVYSKECLNEINVDSRTRCSLTWILVSYSLLSNYSDLMIVDVSSCDFCVYSRRVLTNDSMTVLLEWINPWFSWDSNESPDQLMQTTLTWNGSNGCTHVRCCSIRVLHSFVEWSCISKGVRYCNKTTHCRRVCLLNRFIFKSVNDKQRWHELKPRKKHSKE